MIWLLKALLVLPVKIAAGGAKAAGATTAGSFRLGYRTGRIVGYRRVLLLVLGAVAALFFTPFSGPELRERVARKVGSRTGAGQAASVPPPAHAPAGAPSTPPSATPAPPATVDVTGVSAGAASVPADGDVVDTTRPVDGAALEDPASAPDGPIE